MNFSKKKVAEKHKALVSTPRKMKTKVLITISKFIIFILVLGIATVGFFGLGMIKGIIDGAPSIDSVNISPVEFSTSILDSDGNEIEKLITDGSNRQLVSIKDIPDCLKYAFIDIEDERFETHNGIDIKGIIRSIWGIIQTGSASQGGASTITQQLLKNNVFENGGQENNLGELISRKIQEQYLALQLEKTMSKDIILENYLNTINLGAGNYGVQAAATRYFNKSVSDLTVSESAVIASITKAPYTYNPITNPEKNAERREKVLKNMLKNGHITQAEFDEAMADNVYDRIQDVNVNYETASPYSYFVDEVIDQVIKDLQEQKAYTYTQAVNAVYSGGLTIYSTQDTTIQNICDEELSDPANYPENIYYSFSWQLTVKHEDGEIENYSNVNITYYNKRLLGNTNFKIIFSSQEEAQECIDNFKAEYIKEGDEIVGENVIFTLQPQVSFTVIDQSTGYVKAIIGGRGEKVTSRTLNRATDSTRQPGSTFKVLSAFAPAIDRYNYTLATVFDDAPYAYTSSGRAISNWWGDYYYGLSSIRRGIQKSMNIIAVKCLTAITPEVGFEYLMDFGFTTLVQNRVNSDNTVNSDINQSLALGGLTDGVTNIELCNAYATIANGGVYTELSYYTKVLDNKGRVILDKTPNTHRVLKETTAYLVTTGMHDVVIDDGTGRVANIEGQYVSGKTGTTSNDYDIWFAGYTPYLTATIWSGFDENTGISDTVYNTQYHKVLWSKIMTRIHQEKGYTYKEPEMPANIVTAQICKKCGMLAVDGLCNNDPEGNMIVTEYFAEGTVPEDTCICHVKYKICNSSNKLAGDACPDNGCTEKVYRIRFLGSNPGDVTYDTPYLVPAGLEGSSCTVH
ncbi:MAG: transglycosylase domain-containing protein [Lachnospiraceae bacterium]|nr:transglycosylase domain-containing protein [Lachnospiraceae bacterium]MDE6698798.1 transglycosylase domain-containing protein [Lachnospiraceae bacterium]